MHTNCVSTKLRNVIEHQIAKCVGSKYSGMSEEYVINPATGRKIKVGGPTYLKIMGRLPGAPSRSRGSRTRGWREAAPKKGAERHQLKQQCGSKCFLQPETEGFPVCAKCVGDQCSCQIDCRGVAAANVRAHQYHHTNLYQAIDLLKAHC